MRVFFDTEFTGLHQNTTLISIGLVSQYGRTFYAELNDYDRSQVDDWLRKNVIAHLKSETGKYDSYANEPNIETADTVVLLDYDRSDIEDYLKRWLVALSEASSNEPLEMWSDCLAYDWVLFCQLFGGAKLVPDYVYYIPFDLSTAFKLAGIDPDINRESFAGPDVFNDWLKAGNKFPVPKHNALWDAKIIKACYENLIARRKVQWQSVER